MSRDFSLDGWTVRPQRGVVERDGQMTRVKPKAMAVLECLAGAAGEVVTRNALFDAVWPGQDVSDATLSQCIVELRQAFGETAKDPRVIETIPRVGFRLVPAPVRTVDTADSPAALPAEDQRVAKPGVLASIVFIVFFLLLLLWMQQDGEMDGPSRSVAVLPFVDMSPEQDQGHFADGLTEELISHLAQIDGLVVTGRTSTFQFKGRNPGLDEVGETLGVEYVLEGSIRKSGDELRITAQLLEVEDGFHAWTDSYDRPLTDFIEVQEEIAAAVATALKIRLNVAPRGSPHATTSLEAYELVMRATEHGKDMSKAALQQREEYLRRATEIDPSYAFAWAYLAQLYHVSNDRLSDDWREQSMAWLDRALSLEPDSPWVLEFAVYVYVSMQQWSNAERAIQRLTELKNTDVNAAHLELMVKSGHAQESLLLGERAIRRDPLSRHFRTYLQHAYAMNGRLDEALRESEAFYQWEADQISVIEGMVTAFSHPDPARLDNWLARLEGFSTESGINTVLADMKDDPDAALAWLRQAEIPTSAGRYTAPAWAAYLGDPGLSLELLKQSPDLWIFWMPHNAEVRRLEGFKDLVEDLGLVDYWREFGWGDFCRPVGENDFECD